MQKHIDRHITITHLPKALCGVLTEYRKCKAAALKQVVPEGK